MNYYNKFKWLLFRDSTSGPKGKDKSKSKSGETHKLVSKSGSRSLLKSIDSKTVAKPGSKRLIKSKSGKAGK